ncbi:MAG: DegT/DnrJ/EryC1/StrS aminotransferase family protein [Candidatus Omnitrophica bacterium]|nr:DegT/DnrJ/EryC1/StrS aminotransferase family protein [Candidatus Omnitrophota bacterium]
MRKNFLIFGAPQITEEDLQAVIDTFKSGWIGTGPQAAELERAFRRYKGASHAAALSSCTAALHLAMLALGIQPGDEVITSPMTFCATANAIVHAGARPVFADIDPRTGLIDPTEIEKKITPKTRAIIPIHLSGRPCDMDAILAVARSRNIYLVEDCAHAIETTYHARHAGTFGDAGCFSFYVTKNMTAIEGGMAISQKAEIVEKIKTLALHGMTADAWNRFSDAGYKHYEVSDLGYKNNLPDVHAALALSQLKRIESNLARREALWGRYDEAFENLPCFTPPPPEKETRHARHLYTLLLDIDSLAISRDQFLDELHRRNIGCGVHYLSLHLHRYYREAYHLQPNDYPNALWHSDRTVSLPLSAALSDQDAGDVVEAVQDILNRAKK